MDRHVTPRPKISVDADDWAAFGELVGDGGRSAAIRDYIRWQLENPDTPLPGRFRGPVKKVRRRSDGKD